MRPVVLATKLMRRSAADSVAVARLENAPDQPAHEKSSMGPWGHFGILTAAYVVLTALTNADWMGDTVYYVASILTLKRGVPAGGPNALWDFGHLLWKPLGSVCLQLTQHLMPSLARVDQRLLVIFLLMTINWLAGLLAVLLVYDLAGRVTKRRTAAYLASAMFLCSNAFLNYSHTGTSYVPGLALLIVGVWVLVTGADRGHFGWSSAILAGVALGGSVLLWFPYILAIPAALASALFLSGPGVPTSAPGRVRLVAKAAFACAVATGSVYAMVLADLHLYALPSIKAWIAGAGHGWAQTITFTRMIFGLPRSFLYMGQDGLLFKRYLLHDPYAPVGIAQLVRLTLWKLAVFYLSMTFLLYGLFHSPRGRKILALLTLSALPVFYFAIFLFESGGAERYLSIYPFLFLAMAYAWTNESARSSRYATMAFAATLLISNLAALSRFTTGQQEVRVVSRVGSLAPLLKPNSRVVVANLQDELVEFTENFPFHPLNSSGNLGVYSVVMPGTTGVTSWRESFARLALGTWKNGGDIWLSTRLLAERPLPEWNWAEGDDPRISWNHFYPFFRALEREGPSTNQDSFVRILPSPQNEQLLMRLVSNETGNKQERAISAKLRRENREANSIQTGTPQTSMVKLNESKE